MRIVKYGKQDLGANMEAFCELFHKVFTAKANPEIIEQRYLHNPHDDLLMYIAEDDGKIVANYSAVPLMISVDGKLHKAALSLNTMTDPAYAGRGLFSTLANELYDYMQQAGYAVIIGFPNNLSNRTFNNWLGWKTIYEIPTLKLDLNSVKIKTSNYHFYDGFDKAFIANSKGSIFVNRSSEYLEWRYKNNKEKEYRYISIDNENWAVVHFYGEEVNITDIVSNDKTKEQALILRIIQIGIENHFKYVTLWYKTNTQTHGFLEKTGFRLSAPIRTFGLRCFDETIADAVYDASNWWIQMGDDNSY